MCVHRLRLQATTEVAETAVCVHVTNVHNLSKRQRSSCFNTRCVAAERDSAARPPGSELSREGLSVAIVETEGSIIFWIVRYVLYEG